MKMYDFYDRLMDREFAIEAEDFWIACAKARDMFNNYYFYTQIVYVGEAF